LKKSGGVNDVNHIATTSGEFLSVRNGYVSRHGTEKRFGNRRCLALAEEQPDQEKYTIRL